MHPSLQQLSDKVDLLISTISAAPIDRDSFQDHGWNQLPLNKDYIEYLASNFQIDIKKVSSNKFEKDVAEHSEYILKSAVHIEQLTSNLQTYLTDYASHLIHSVPNSIITILTIHLNFKSIFLNWDSLQDKKLLPQNLSRRIRATESRISTLNTSSENLEEKIKLIQEAYDAAESLPTYLQEIKDGKSELEAKLKQAESTLKKIENAQNTSSNTLDSSLKYLEKIKINTNETEILKTKCDENLQITTTQGLAAGFDQKAKSLANSIKYWVIGLIIALCTGGYFGGTQVQKLSILLDSNQQISIGSAIIHAILAIFSIGGPLWFAWLATQQINQRFKLSEDYDYKATVAKSYTGFSKHATRFDEQTAERLFNSTLDRLDEMPLRLVESKDYNSPWHEFIDSEAFKKALSMVPDLADKASTFAARTKMKEKPVASTKNNIKDPSESTS
ncbi:hypothetical protein VFES401_15175 [Aliivibrio fischeri]|uniref:hypothetical protein n=1 Tax=Aliivibrio fischeri TaxID=668 RepID=UPI00107EE328|nr:hypothetical protein [Aliivibrio fischeri]TGA68226.1 hypothetical protein VFES401_15175 [Aliivibrio fischeri]